MLHLYGLFDGLCKPRYPLSVPTARSFAVFAKSDGGVPRSPQDLYRAYSLPDGDSAGSGVTVAVVAAFHASGTYLQSDFDAFNSAFGLPAAVLEILYSRSGADETGDGQSGRAVDSWRLEATADASWLHAVAPGAKILCVLAPNAAITSLMQAALAAAEKADIVSMSFGSAEFDTQRTFDEALRATGKCFVASSGDAGGAVCYPSASASAVSVGGALFHRNPVNGRVFSYSAWENGGGGPSLYTGIPEWQRRFVPIAAMSGDRRATPDIALDACLSPGYAVYDRAADTFRGICGTSIGAPVFSGLLARHMASCGRRLTAAEAGKALYAAAGSDFYDSERAKASYYDVILGSNGRFEARIGYDFCTGLGVPLGKMSDICRFC